jgi:putative flippase GtrA
VSATATNRWDPVRYGAVFLGSALSVAVAGPLAGLGLSLLAAYRLRRSPFDSAAIEIGVLSGVVLKVEPVMVRAVVVVGAGLLGALLWIRARRGRAQVIDARIWGVVAGFAALCLGHIAEFGGTSRATTWLLLCGWTCAVLLGLLTEGFAQKAASSPAEFPSVPTHSQPAQAPVSFRKLALDRGSVGRTALSAGAATFADFCVFSVLLPVVLPGVATLLGSLVGGVLNFTINRRWAFESGGTMTQSAMRYVWVSGASALLNSMAVSIALLEPTVSPVSAWIVARSLSFLGWNYPMQRDHVFAR